MEGRWSPPLFALFSPAPVIAPAFAEHREVSPSGTWERGTVLVKLAPNAGTVLHPTNLAAGEPSGLALDIGSASSLLRRRARRAGRPGLRSRDSRSVGRSGPRCRRHSAGGAQQPVAVDPGPVGPGLRRTGRCCRAPGCPRGRRHAAPQ